MLEDIAKFPQLARGTEFDAQPLPTGHYLQEEAPDQVIDHFIKFFTT
jgi:hypothetical protein